MTEIRCIREVLVDLVEESRTAFPPRLLECLATNDARRAAGDLEPGARHLLDPATLAFFARSNSFPRTPARSFLPDYHELVAADLLWRYGWSADEAGLAFDDWKKEHQQEMLEVISMSCTDAGPNPFAEDLQSPPQTTPTGANPLEEGLGALSLSCPPSRASGGFSARSIPEGGFAGSGWAWPCGSGLRRPRFGLEPR